jgi:phosphatidylglycerophosphatase C
VTTKSPSEIPLVRADALVAEMQGVRGALAFDGDGTLWSGDVGEDFFFGILDAERLSPLAGAEVDRVARAAGIDVGPSAAETARRIYQAYLAGRFDEETVCEVMTWICAGWTSTEVSDFVRSVVGRSFAARIHPEVARVIAGARARDHEVFVVSASPRPIVEAAAAVAGIPSAHVLAATAVLEGDRYAAAVHRPIPYGAGKASALHKALEERGGGLRLLAAFGDNAFDAEMLAMSDRPIAVRPKPRLVAHAHAIPGIRALQPEG